MKILMVCLGNICRSPLAEGILKEKIKENGLPWEVDSAGTGSWHVGEPPDPRSVAVARAHGIDILDQRARQFRPADFRQFDLIFAMDASNYQNILRMAPSGTDTSKVELIMNVVDPGRNRAVPDPYWDDNGFEGVFRMLDEACERIIQRHARG
ncbi:MAG: low molecular weight phosphotyrosine protein phosphatase [Saprospiraceae bacterium]|nr:low molecular weight phosphotyrosine protein phosphatase [Saprospiraceae bacterium]MCB0678158.1 low molecular weight phosphotyrosine protein phosphatase [Saprospiraceae bacterium]MCB0682275.1 low molecular weight phosphotyrosine protein phosphatase [Saprospiraceae bacterium]